MSKLKNAQKNEVRKKRAVLVQVTLGDPDQVVAMDRLVKKFRSSRSAVLRLGLDFLTERELAPRSDASWSPEGT